MRIIEVSFFIAAGAEEDECWLVGPRDTPWSSLLTPVPTIQLESIDLCERPNIHSACICWNIVISAQL